MGSIKDYLFVCVWLFSGMSGLQSQTTSKHAFVLDVGRFMKYSDSDYAFEIGLRYQYPIKRWLEIGMGGSLVGFSHDKTINPFDTRIEKMPEKQSIKVYTDGLHLFIYPSFKYGLLEDVVFVFSETGLGYCWASSKGDFNRNAYSSYDGIAWHLDHQIETIDLKPSKASHSYAFFRIGLGLYPDEIGFGLEVYMQYTTENLIDVLNETASSLPQLANVRFYDSDIIPLSVGINLRFVIGKH